MTLPGGAYNGSAVGYQEVSNAGGFIPELWTNEVKRRRYETFIMKSTVKMFPTMANKGDVLHIPEIGRLAVNDKVANSPVTLQARTETEYTITVDRYKESSFMIEDIAVAQTSFPLRKEYVDETGEALARDMDNSIFAERAQIQGYLGIDGATSEANVVYSSTDGTSGGTPLALNRASILAAKEVLDEANVPDDDRVLVVSPSQYNDLLTIEQFISFDYTNGKPTVSGLVGSLYGTPVIKTNAIITNSVDGYFNGDRDSAVAQPTPGVTDSPYFPTQTLVHFGTTVTPASLPLGFKTAMMVHRDWCRVVWVRAPRVESSRETLFQADAVVATQIYGVKGYRPDHAVLVHTA